MGDGEERIIGAGTALSRRTLLANGLAVGAVGLLPSSLQTAHAASPSKSRIGRSMLLRNILLETGYVRDGADFVGTQTGTFSLLVKDGRVAAILPATASTPAGVRAYDGAGMLALPAFKDMHIHLDKTFYGGPWVPPLKRKNGIPGQIERERALLPQMLPTLEDRAGKLVDLLLSNGTTFARSQCNVDPVQGTRHVEMLKHALDQRADVFGCEIVAFPQHGFVSANMIPTMRAALAAGATHVGGIDPTAVDGGMERSVDAMMELAIDMNKSVDIHLHEPGASGIAAIRRMADIVERTPTLKGKVTISHGFALMSLSEPEMAEMAARLAALQMSVASTLPMGGRIMPVPALLKAGVQVYTGTDSVQSHWSVFGSGDVLEKSKLACQLYGWADEYTISQSLKIATGGPTPLDGAGKQQWPKVGDAADMVLMPASCAAEAAQGRFPSRHIGCGRPRKRLTRPFRRVPLAPVAAGVTISRHIVYSPSIA
jgi:cytosine/adenosine deaminase-related metal-dependent hydrolase